MKLWVKVIIAIALGIVTGLVCGPSTEVLKPIGTLFINSLTMLVVPLVFSSMVTGITSMPDSKKLGRVGGVTLLLYFVTTAIAIVLGLSVSHFLEIGKELHFTLPTTQVVKALPSFGDLLTSFVPKNPIQAFAEGNVLQIILFSVLFGTSLNLVGEKGKPLLTLFQSLSQTMLRLTSLIMSLSPIGVFAIMASTCGTFGLEVLVPVLKFLGAYWAASLLFAGVIFSALLLSVRLSPIPFFKGMTEAIATAISTCSSSASLASNLHCGTKNLGISEPLANFVLPLGCTLNMNGSALFQSMSALFVAQAYGIDLTLQHMVVLSMTVILATLGTASIPGGGLLMLSIVFASVGIPIEGIAIIAGVDRLRDMATTALNITGDAACAVYMAKKEGELDERIYYAQNDTHSTRVEA